MFVLPALILPLVFALAMYRLYRIPLRLRSGELRLPVRRRALWMVAGAAAYGLLLVGTLVMMAALGWLLMAEPRLETYTAVLAAAVAYPVLYVAAAWIFYYALIPVAGRR